MTGDDPEDDDHEREGGVATPAVPWLPETLDPGLLAVAYRDLGDFVAWLRDLHVDVPQCWYVHGWIVHRLLAVQHWYTAIRDGRPTPRTTVDWWALGLQPLVHDWADVLAHRGRHAPDDDPFGPTVTTPTLEEVIIQAIRRRREQAS